jgi:hypothetical protein
MLAGDTQSLPTFSLNQIIMASTAHERGFFKEEDSVLSHEKKYAPS